MSLTQAIVGGAWGALFGGLVSLWVTRLKNEHQRVETSRAFKLARLERIVELTDAMTRHLSLLEAGNTERANMMLEKASAPKLSFYVSAFLPEATDDCEALTRAINEGEFQAARDAAWMVDKKAAVSASGLV